MSVAAETRDLWLFGYGSLIWKADFVFAKRQVAAVSGWHRRFWQGSHDHRGTPEAPGRVVTLIRCEPDTECIGMAYRVAAADVPQVLEHLDFREKNGYERHTAPLRLDDGVTVEGLLYVATPSNFAHLGPASDEEIAAQIATSHGPSGSNQEYLMNLHEALVDLGQIDPHVARLVELVQASNPPLASERQRTPIVGGRGDVK